jgi:hypothetical protein
MSKRRLRIVASVLILVALVLLVVGLASDQGLVWGLGLGSVAIAMAMSLATRWVGEGED